MSNTKTHAQRELEILINTTPDAIIKDFIPEILSICEKFGNLGQSGGSAPYTAGALADAVKKLCLQLIIAPLTGKDDEWNDTGETLNKSESNEMYQNNRLSSVFKDGKNGKAYYLNAITWKNQEGSGYSGTARRANGEIITSRQYIKSFPFKPQEFVIDVIEKEIGKDDFEFTIKNDKDLEKVFEIYDKFN